MLLLMMFIWLCSILSSLRGDPTLPQNVVVDELSGVYDRVADIVLKAGTSGDDFQNALNVLEPGQILELEAGGTWTGRFRLPKKDNSSEYMLIRSSAYASLPPAGHRVSPSHASLMPKIVAKEDGSGVPAIGTRFGAHHYYFLGLEVTVEPTSTRSNGLISVGVINGTVSWRDGTAKPTEISQVPHHLIFDRCYVHGNTDGQMKRGIELNAIHGVVINSYLSDWHCKGQDSQAISAWNTPGPITIKNNFLEAAGENIIFGGADPKIHNLVPSDIIVSDNYLYKPFNKWRSRGWSVKNSFELKNARRVLITNNTFDGNWKSGQVGYAILFTPKNQGGNAPWSTVEDVTFTHNSVINTAQGISIITAGPVSSTPPVKHVLVRDNLVLINRNLNGDGHLFSISCPSVGDYAEDISFVHNTFLSASITVDGSVLLDSTKTGSFLFPASIEPNVLRGGFNFSNNVVSNGRFGIYGSGTFGDVLNRYMPDATFEGNVIVGISESDLASLPSSNLGAPNDSYVNFMNVKNGDFFLGEESAFKRSGKNPGIDINLFNPPQCFDCSPPDTSPIISTCGPALCGPGTIFEPWPESQCHPIKSSSKKSTMPVLPQVSVDTRLPSNLHRPADVVLNAGTSASELQNALDALEPGQILELEAGANWTGRFRLPQKGSSSQYMIVRSSAYTSLPLAGQRVSPQHASLMPKIVAKADGSGVPAIGTRFGAHHYYFLGLEIMVEPTAVRSNGIISVGVINGTIPWRDGTAKPTEISQLPHHLIFDRCYVHGNTDGQIKVGIELNGMHVAVINSYFSDFHMRGFDSQAIVAWNTPGPVTIENNFLEAAGENVMFGGADPWIPNTVPSDIIIRGNTIYKPLSWRSLSESWTVKNLLELKNARRVLIENNTLDGSWPSGQVGFAILLTPKNQAGRGPQSTVEDVTVVSNTIFNTAQGISLIDRGSGLTISGLIQSTQYLKRVLIRDNLLLINRDLGGGGRLFEFGCGKGIGDSEGVTVVHNTFLHAVKSSTDSWVLDSTRPASFITAGDTAPCVTPGNFNFSFNIISAGAYGIAGSATSPYGESFNKFFPNSSLEGNIIIGIETKNFDKLPSGNFRVPNDNSIPFADAANGDFSITSKPPFLLGQMTPGANFGAPAVTLCSTSCTPMVGPLPAASSACGSAACGTGTHFDDNGNCILGSQTSSPTPLTSKKINASQSTASLASETTVPASSSTHLTLGFTSGFLLHVIISINFHYYM